MQSIIRDISLSNKNKVAKYIFEANKEFYNLFGQRKNFLNLCDMINDERTEEFNLKSTLSEID